MDLVLRLVAVPDELSRPIPALVKKPAERLMDGGHDVGPFDGGWMGMVKEFRNQLTIFLANTNQLSAMLPRAVACEFVDRLDGMESSAEFLQTLLTWMDASIGRGSQAISEVSDLLQRAEILARTGLPHRVRVRLEPRPAAVRNRGAAIECALAALIMELGRVCDRRMLGDDGLPESAQICVTTHPQRGALSIVLSSSGGQPPEGGWRVSLAKALLAQVGGTIEPLDRGSGLKDPGFDVRFRFQ